MEMKDVLLYLQKQNIKRKEIERKKAARREIFSDDNIILLMMTGLPIIGVIILAICFYFFPPF